MKYRVLKYLFPIFSFVLLACEVNIPETVIQPEKMEALLYDYHLVQVMVTDVNDDYKRKLYAEYVFNKHGVTKTDFDSSMVWYTRNPKYLYAMYSSMCDKLNAEVELIEGGKSNNLPMLVSDSTYMLADTVDLWRGIKVELLSATPLRNRIKYSYAADSTYRKGDSIGVSMDVLFISADGSNRHGIANAALVVEYADSTFCSDGVKIAASGRYDLSVPRNYENEIKEIRGFVYYSDSDTLARNRMLIGNISVMRIHPDSVDEIVD